MLLVFLSFALFSSKIDEKAKFGQLSGLGGPKSAVIILQPYYHMSAGKVGSENRLLVWNESVKTDSQKLPNNQGKSKINGGTNTFFQTRAVPQQKR